MSVVADAIGWSCSNLTTSTTNTARMRYALSWSNPRFRGIVWQVVVIGAVLGAAWWIVGNTRHNLEVRQIASGFDFLFRESGLPIGEHLISYSPADTYARALVVGVLNTLRVAAVGIILATLLGTLIGIARLSRNWLLSRFAATYVEIVRDIPLLLQLLLWYALIQQLPRPRQALQPVEGVFLSNRGLVVPSLDWMPGHGYAALALVAGVLASLGYHRCMLARQLEDGRTRRSWPVVVVLTTVLPIGAALLSGAGWRVQWPELRSFNIQGGIVLSPEYFALLTGLVVYTAAFIAEIVRAGILSIRRGQWEVAQALGMRRSLILRLVILPQALRIIIPPMTSQFLNLTKNSSLAVAIGYQDIVSIANTVINQTGQAVEGIAIIMSVYLTISLTISLLMNWYNRRVGLVER